MKGTHYLYVLDIINFSRASTFLKVLAKFTKSKLWSIWILPWLKSFL